MMNALAGDLGARAVLNELRYQAVALQQAINHIIVTSDPDLHPNCIQWRMCHCSTVALILTDDGNLEWVATLSKPTGPVEALTDYIRPRLPDLRGVHVHLAVM